MKAKAAVKAEESSDEDSSDEEDDNDTEMVSGIIVSEVCCGQINMVCAKWGSDLNLLFQHTGC